MYLVTFTEENLNIKTSFFVQQCRLSPRLHFWPPEKIRNWEDLTLEGNWLIFSTFSSSSDGILLSNSMLCLKLFSFFLLLLDTSLRHCNVTILLWRHFELSLKSYVKCCILRIFSSDVIFHFNYVIFTLMIKLFKFFWLGLLVYRHS